CGNDHQGVDRNGGRTRTPYPATEGTVALCLTSRESEMTEQPTDDPHARICVLHYHDETKVVGNVAGFSLLGRWIAWLADAPPEENFHMHLLWHLESQASRFDGMRPRNVWVL